MRGPHHVVLVPGFFGFAGQGDLAYFAHVEEALRTAGPGLGLDGAVRVVRTEPTASLPRRAVLVAECIAGLLDEAGGEVSIVGHSSGGVDARLLLSPGVSLPTTADVERCARSVRALLTLSSPHHGTPLAQHFHSVLGQQLLRLLSLATITTLRTGRLPLGAALRLARLLRRDGTRAQGVVEQLYAELLADFSGDRRRAVEEFFAAVRSDQDLLAQITPAGMELVNASTRDRPGVRYGCVVSQARAPGLRSLARAGLHAYGQATHALFTVLHRFSRGSEEDPRPVLRVEQAAVLRGAYGRVPPPEANDGIIPTLSQVRGELVAAVWADHHDVLGHFHQPSHDPPHVDWVVSGTGFDRPQFEALWQAALGWLGARSPLATPVPLRRR